MLFSFQQPLLVYAVKLLAPQLSRVCGGFAVRVTSSAYLQYRLGTKGVSEFHFVCETLKCRRNHTGIRNGSREWRHVL